MKTLSWRPILILAVIIAAVVYVLPTIKPSLWPHKKINLGLDLQGGMHLVMEVDAEKAVENATDHMALELRELLRSEHIQNNGVERKETQITVKIRKNEDMKKFDDLLNREFPDLRILSGSLNSNTEPIILDLPDSDREQIKKSATEQVLETIRNRIDQFGVSEPDIRHQGEKRILIQLPGVTDTERAKDLIGKTALLEFKLVDEEHEVNSALEGDTPQGSEILYEERSNPETGRTQRIPYLLKKRAVLTGSYLTDAKVQIESQYNEVSVSMKLDKKGARIFEKITEDNINKRLAIVLDNHVYSAPVIRDRIPNGEARITGNYTTAEAHDLAIVLRAGALPAPVTIIEERTVGPSLGSDSIRKGLISMLISGILIIIFMVIYYKGSGLIADVALILNILLISAGLAGFQATLTLPGIAGIILTIGMAVDANVLIYERIREELRSGKTTMASVIAGYDRATLTILDANVTTLIAGLVLFQFGTGPVKGFAVTLSLGVVTSVFTALYVTRLIFDFLLINRKVKKLSI